MYAKACLDHLGLQVAIEGEADMPPNVPAPRANHTATCLDNSIVLFGGHGGVGFQRRPCGPYTFGGRLVRAQSRLGLWVGYRTNSPFSRSVHLNTSKPINPAR